MDEKKGTKRWVCPRCNQPAKKTKHHICPKKDFRYSPIVFICWDCHSSLNDIIHEMEKDCGGKLQIEEYFNIWKFFSGQNVDNLYNERKNNIEIKNKR